ncbi:MAG: carboxypeptidase regulatory-like domain-containing protein [Planctomycetes bacterium]|nr:carboxypeptidase regulatory-like domain-containing protein [Planctomycetota bacterium]MCB9909108.1 carboxypeptidase regulatory-like domain-containing protein [Planctomycetota bacterium]MCB9911642.1 carboxypeptidase regulatory-like domain-containing protein [Planctomycetota bacterium]HPF14467.1 carboxypeptidase-like regulatory domain-containing protein [Planctomycetota bacterium]
MRSPLALLLLLALIGAGWLTFLYLPTSDSAPTGSGLEHPGANEAPDGGLEPNATGDLLGLQAEVTPDLNAAVPQAERSLVRGPSREVRVEVHLPEGARFSPDTRVVALPKKQVGRTNGRSSLDELNSGHDVDFAWTAAGIGSGGSAHLTIPAEIEEPVVLIDDRFLYMQASQPVEADAVSVVIEPLWGSCLTVLLESPDLEEPQGTMRLMGFKTSGMGSFSSRTSSASQHDFRGLAGDLTWMVKPDLEQLYSDAKMGVELPAGEQREVRLVLSRGCTIMGRVLDDQGQPMANIEVRLTDNLPWMRMLGGPPKSKTDAEGRYRIGPVGEGVQTVEASEDGRLPAKSEELELVDGEVRSGVDLVLSLGASITGRVLDPAGTPVARAQVVAETRQAADNLGPWGGGGRKEAASASTDSDGRFELTGLEQGKFTIKASRRGEGTLGEKATFYGEANAVAAGTQNLVLRLAAPIVLAGSVVDDLGQPVKRFSLTGRSTVDGGPTEKQNFDDPDGAFQFERLPAGSWTLAVDAKGYYQGDAIPVDLPGAPKDLRIVVQRCAAISGVVLDSGGAPIAGAAVTAKEPGANTGFQGWGGGPRTVSDSEGAYVLEDLDPVTWEVVASAPDWADSPATTVTLAPGIPAEGVALTLRRGGRIVGVVSSPDGTPLAGQRISWGDNPMGFGGRGEATSDASGRFSFDKVTPGEWQVTATPPMDVLGDRMQKARGPQAFTAMMEDLLTTTADVREGETTEVLLGGDPVKPVRIVGKVERGGAPLVGAQVYAVSEGSAVFQGMKTAMTAADGTYELIVDRPGAYAFSASKANLGVESLVEVPRSESFRVDLVIPGGDLAGIVTLPNGDPAPGIRMGLEREDGLGRIRWSGDSVRTDVEGQYRFEGLAPGVYTVRLNAGGFNGAASTAWATQVKNGLRVGAEGETRMDFRLQKPGVIEGIVRGPDGLPVDGATVFFRDTQGNQIAPLSSTETDATGHFERKGLAEGTYTLVAKNDRWASIESPAIPVQAGSTRTAKLDLVAATMLVVTLEDREAGQARLRVQVLDGDGRDLARMTTMTAMRTAFRSGYSSTERRVGPLAPGEYRVVASTADGRSQEEVVRVAGQVPEMAVRLVLEP